MKTVKIILKGDNKGGITSTLETDGFRGEACKGAEVQAFKAKLGEVSDETLKDEFYQSAGQGEVEYA